MDARGLGGLAVVLLIGQAVARHTALESADHPLLRSLGMTRAELFALGVGRVVAGRRSQQACSRARSRTCSPRWPRSALPGSRSPSPGIAMDAAVFVAAARWTAALRPAGRARPRVACLAARSRGAVGRVLAGRDLLARAGLPLTGVAGVRMALEPGRGPTAVPVRSTLVSAVIGIAAVAAALTITASADRLLTTPRLYGQNWDAQIGDGNVPGYSRGVHRGAAGGPVDRRAGGRHGPRARLDGRPTAVFGLEAIRGPLSLTMLEGRPPAAPDEILLGSTAAAALDARVGDTVEGRLGRSPRPVRVVGRAVLPEVGFTAISPGRPRRGCRDDLRGAQAVRSHRQAAGLRARCGARGGSRRDARPARARRRRDRPQPAGRGRQLGPGGAASPTCSRASSR